MKPITAKVGPALQIGSRIKCADNSGATEVEVIAVKGYKGVSRRVPYCGVGSLVVAAVKKGDQKLKHEIVLAVIVRQRKEFRRRSGLRVKFEDNAVVIVNEKGEPKGSRIKGPIAKEVVERFSAVGKIATMVM